MRSEGLGKPAISTFCDLRQGPQGAVSPREGTVSPSNGIGQVVRGHGAIMDPRDGRLSARDHFIRRWTNVKYGVSSNHRVRKLR